MPETLLGWRAPINKQDVKSGYEDTMKIIDIVSSIWNNRGYRYPSHTDCCYTFQVVSSMHRYITRCDYDSGHDDMFLLAAYHLNENVFLDIDQVSRENGWKTTRRRIFDSISDALAFVEEINPLVTCGLNVFNPKKNKFYQVFVLHFLHGVNINLIGIESKLCLGIVFEWFG
eukprot:TRINITY_DN7675_c0_g1_i1.p1 TRINITY_DN7675_c0_g1~~TRINITY_DN7675_c0_g1_i1.p1  ORF type:complete len:172 (+),score=2.84 TRINITY_DN7675_c0_g1_i1:303-818(+)